MIRAVAFCPMAPVLVPDVAQGAAGELDGLRAACRTAILRADAPGRQWLVVGPGGTSRRFGPTSRGTFAGYGVPLELGLGSDEPGPVELPPALAVGAWLLRDCLGAGCGASGWSIAGADDPVLVGWDDDVAVHGRDHALLVMGDGSARRNLKAPGYLDERAAPFDAAVADALRSGRPARLRELPDARDLLVSGVAVWTALSHALAQLEFDAELLHDAAPYGVGYLVASWVTRG